MSFFITSCESLYLPNSVNVPCIKEKGDFNAQAHLSPNGTNVNLAYCIKDKFIVTASGVSLNDSEFYHKFAEIGGGYVFYETKTELADFYISIGKGYTSYDFSSLLFSSSFEGNYTRIFMQPSYAIVDKNADIIFSLRNCIGYFNRTENGITKKFKTGYLEPVITAKFGLKNIKFITQAGVSLPINFKEKKFASNPIIFSIGLEYKPNLLKKRKN